MSKAGPYGAEPHWDDAHSLAGHGSKENDGSTVPLTAPAESSSANRGMVQAVPSAAAQQLAQSLLLDEGSWVITAEMLASASGAPATGGAPAFNLEIRYGAGRGVVVETLVVPGHGMVLGRSADVMQLRVSVPASSNGFSVVVFARKSLFGPSLYLKDSIAAANALVTVAQFAKRVQVLGTPADTVQCLTNGGAPLAPALVVPASGVLSFDIPPRCEQLQLASAAQNILVWECAS